jgi:hypothetical protein
MRNVPAPEVRIFKTVIAVGSALLRMDTIEFQGLFWLVPDWLEELNEGLINPTRIICLAGLRYQDLRCAGRPARSRECKSLTVKV